MKPMTFALILLTTVLLCCKTGKQKDPAEKNAKPANYFPVADYLRSEIHYVDSLPLGITKYTVNNAKTDTFYIQAAEFDRITKDFISNDLEPEVFEKAFSETSFIDASTRSATFTYSPKNSDQTEVTRVDVLTSAGEGTNKVSSIYLEMLLHKNDTTIIKKLLWRTRTSLQIVSSKEVKGQQPVVDQLKLVWGIE